VAIKEAQITSDQVREEFLAEAKLMLRLRPHGNVIQVFGVAVKDNNMYYMQVLCGASRDESRALTDFWVVAE